MMNVQALLQMNTIFISILIESLPFILLGVLISGIIQIFVSEEMIAKIIPKNPILSVLSAIGAGVFFLACECGIVPITRRLIAKGVPLSAAIAFMLSAPILNPIVLFSTYIAFGNSWSMVFYRGGIAFAVVLIIAFILSFQFKTNQLKQEHIEHIQIHHHKLTFKDKITGMFKHSIEEFFSVGKYLIIGALLAAAIQTFLKTSLLLDIGQGKLSGNAVMMALSYVMSLCSQADAFVASSFRSTFSPSSLVAFLVFGAMFDIKNTIMLLGTFKTKFVLCLMAYIFISVLGLTLLFIS
ncbi:permease [Peribacillus frigoritolerans]|uniref:permease n=1 Tax=Peribacillus frigoritolerans TaxID=450367 RepID=UPI003D2B823C